MELSERIVDDIAFVDVTGRVFGRRGEASLADTVSRLGQRGYTRVVVDLGNVTYMDSAGLGDLIHAYSLMKKGGGALKLIRVTRRLHALLTITQLVTLFESYDDEAAAVASFAAAA